MDEDGGGGGSEGGGGECRRCGRPGWRPGAGVAGAPDWSGAAGPGPGLGGPGGADACWPPRPAARRSGARRRGPTGLPPNRSGGRGARPGSPAAGAAWGLGAGLGGRPGGAGDLRGDLPRLSSPRASTPSGARPQEADPLGVLGGWKGGIPGKWGEESFQ